MCSVSYELCEQKFDGRDKSIPFSVFFADFQSTHQITHALE